MLRIFFPEMNGVPDRNSLAIFYSFTLPLLCMSAAKDNINPSPVLLCRYLGQFSRRDEITAQTESLSCFKIVSPRHCEAN